MADNDPKIVTYKTPEYREKYSNFISVQATLLDVSLRFGVKMRQEPVDDNGQIFVEYFQTILVSPQEAKLLVGILNDELLRYEKYFGPLPGPRPVVPAEVPEATAVDPVPPEVIQ